MLSMLLFDSLDTTTEEGFLVDLFPALYEVGLG
jgi:hypothetical protein